MPTETLILTLVVFIFMSAICSGLNIALMSLNLHELHRKRKLGDKKAKAIYYFRKNAHLTLASILIANVGFNSGVAILMGDALNGLVAAIITTLLLVIFSELLPQAIFTRDALKFMYRLRYFLRTVIFITYIISKPLQILLDRGFGPEAKSLHSRDELGLLINDHIDAPGSELDEDEVEIIKGALQLSEKQVIDIMTPIRNVFWIHQTANLDDKMIDKIKEAGFSRIPIFNKALTKCYGVLLMKELVDIDFDSQTIKLSDFRLHTTKTIGTKTALDTMFRHFIAARTHLMPVTLNHKIVGIVTIEDLIEEIIGHEIIDESDSTLNRI